MNIDWKILIFGIGFALVMESLFYIISPITIKEVAKQIIRFENKTIRLIGVIAFIIGVLLLILYKYLINI